MSFRERYLKFMEPYRNLPNVSHTRQYLAPVIGVGLPFMLYVVVALFRHDFETAFLAFAVLVLSLMLVVWLRWHMVRLIKQQEEEDKKKRK
jgi:amino acid permease